MWRHFENCKPPDTWRRIWRESQWQESRWKNLNVIRYQYNNGLYLQGAFYFPKCVHVWSPVSPDLCSIFPAHWSTQGMKADMILSTADMKMEAERLHARAKENQDHSPTSLIYRWGNEACLKDGVWPCTLFSVFQGRHGDTSQETLWKPKDEKVDQTARPSGSRYGRWPDSSSLVTS